MPKVSVIIPVYGVERYIVRCAISLFEQTLDDMQFIFVDDCTPDKSIILLKSVIEKYPNRKEQIIILHHEKNEGLPVARQTGIKVALGDYIAHCDSDDWVDRDIYEKMYNAAIGHSADVVVCNCYNTDGNNILSEREGGNQQIIHNCINDMLHGKMWWSLCNKLVNRKIYNQKIEYPKYAMGEDMCITLQSMMYCKKIVYCPEVHYYYYVNEGSITNYLTEKKCVDNFYQICRNVDIVINAYKRNNLYSKYKKGLNYIAFKTKNHLHPLLGNKKYYRLWKTTYRYVEFKILTDSNVTIKELILAALSIIGLFPIPRNKYANQLKNNNANF